MGNSALVRYTRDGDQFHYLWASRRCLRLLSPGADLVAITVEGPAAGEADPTNIIEAGEEVIDIGEYYGNESLTDARLIRYLQLKHSTQNPTGQWTASGLKKTVEGFVARFRALESQFGAQAFENRLEFVFVSNRPIAQNIVDAVAAIAAGRLTSAASDRRTIEDMTGLKGARLTEFCRYLRFEGNQDGYFEQRNLLIQDVTGYLPDADQDAPVQLKELVTRKALSENQENRSITKIDVLRSLKADESRLFPAPCLIQDASAAIPREQEGEYIWQIVGSQSQPIIVHADGGVGKSIFARRIKLGLPEGSECVVYDCFGNGRYRSLSGYRHRHKDALVQISNELAGIGLCHPLVPTPNADPPAYVRAFLFRLQQAAAVVRARSPEAVVCIVIDAADNAEMAAQEAGQGGSFARDLLREVMPESVRLVMLCRSHRCDYLRPPPGTLQLPLAPFSRAETETFLRARFSGATGHDVDEFHRLSSQNPRVQATALSWGGSLSSILRMLGPNPTTVENTLDSLLNHAITKLRDEAGQIEGPKIDAICAGLAALRPLIPIPVLAAIAEVDAAAVKSFALDLGRPLIVMGDTIQFFDEPSETWFREKFKPSSANLVSFVDRLKMLTAHSAYVASTLPQLMLEAGLVADLVNLALSSSSLPEGSPIERRDVEMQRLQFALRASLRDKRYKDATKIALKAGGEAAGDERQQKLIRENTDLASALVGVDGIQEIVARRTFGGGWVGSHHVYEAALMSGRVELAADARSRLRMAREWLRNWSRLPEAERSNERISEEDIAELALAQLNIHGPDACAYESRRWTPRITSFRAGRHLARRLVDHGRFEDLDTLAMSAGNNLRLILAIAVELRTVQRYPPNSAVRRSLRLLLDRRVSVKDSHAWQLETPLLEAIVALVEGGRQLGTFSDGQLATIIARYLPASPPKGLVSRFEGVPSGILTAYTLRAALTGQTIELNDLAHPDLKQELEKGESHHLSEEIRDFKFFVGALLPWYKIKAGIVTGKLKGKPLSKAISEAVSASTKAIRFSYREHEWLLEDVAKHWLAILAQNGIVTPNRLDDFVRWHSELQRPLYTSTLIYLTRISARHPALKQIALNFAASAYNNTVAEREEAETKANTFLSIARAILPTSRSDAATYFNEAIVVASKIGDENLARWEALIDLGNRGADPRSPQPEAAYKFARCAEVTYDYVARDKHFDWGGSIRALVRLCPSSALAITSRWRDRRFGYPPRVLPLTVEALLEDGRVKPKSLAGLIGFRADWEYLDILDAALKDCSSPNERNAVTDLAFGLMRLEGQSSGLWQKFKSTCAAHGISFPELDSLIAFASQREASPTGTAAKRRADQPLYEPPEQDWTPIFSGLDLTVPAGLSDAYTRFRAGGPPFYFEHFFGQGCARIPIGKEAEFIKAFAGMPTFSLFDMREILEKLPSDWLQRPAVKAALAEALKSVCRQKCLRVTKSRYRAILPLAKACEASGVREDELVAITLSAIAERTEIHGAGSLFNLAGLLATTLTAPEALDAFQFGLGAFDAVLEERDGDGPWAPTLAPPPIADDAVAGYIWTALASPRSATRWEAAHVVRGICALGCAGILSRLIEYAKGAEATAFRDVSLHDYSMHARQWLMIALARVALETPASLVPHTDFLTSSAIGGEEHVVIRANAVAAMLSLHEAGHISLDGGVVDKLKRVNVSPFPPDFSRRYKRQSGKPDGQDVADKQEAARFNFGIDVGPYWFDSLARQFNVSQTRIEAMAAKIIRDEWQLPNFERWEQDERQRRRIFRERETYHHQGTYPRTDDLRFYLSYHAMMIAAGRLLATTAVHREQDNEDDRFEDWLRRHTLTRPDGRWLSDRRDPTPLNWPKWKDEAEQDDWRWSISKTDFEAVLSIGSPILTPGVLGRWSPGGGKRRSTSGAL